MAHLISDVFAIFKRYSDTLIEQKEKAYKSINDWQRGMTEEIGRHTMKQRHIIEETYQMYQEHLKEMREQVLAIGKVYDQKNNSAEVHQLLQQCRTLKMELVEIKLVSEQSQFIQITPIKLPELEDHKEFRVAKTENTNFQNTSMPNDDFGSAYNNQPYTTAAWSSRINQPATTITSSYSTTQSTDNTENRTLRTNATGNENLIEKCPICFMIFPSTMLEISRTMHVNEHLSND